METKQLKTLATRLKKGHVLSSLRRTPLDARVIAFCDICPPCEVGRRWDCEDPIDIASVVDNLIAGAWPCD